MAASPMTESVMIIGIMGVKPARERFMVKGSSVFLGAIGAAMLALSVDAKADLLCPKGSLSELLPNAVWGQYVERSEAYVNRLLRRLAENLVKVTEAGSVEAQVAAAAAAGEDHATVMRLFEEGFIAATDIVNAHCTGVPDQAPWSDAIKVERRLVASSLGSAPVQELLTALTRVIADKASKVRSRSRYLSCNRWWLVLDDDIFIAPS